MIVARSDKAAYVYMPQEVVTLEKETHICLCKVISNAAAHEKLENVAGFQQS